MLLQLKLRKVRLKQQKKLNKTNLYLYKSITSYIQNSDLRGIEKEEILQQIIDMMLQAQIENKPVKLIIGDDYEEFCKLIIKEYDSSKSKTYMVLNYIQKYLFWMLLISTVILIFRGISINSLSNMGITLDQFIVANVIALIVFPASKKGKQETASIKSLPQRFLFIISSNRTWGKAVILMMFIFIFTGSVLPEMIGSEFLNYIITPLEAAPYLVLILVLAGIIEIYKRIYDTN